MTDTGSTSGVIQSSEHVLVDYPTTSEETFSKRYTFSYDLGSGAYATVKYANCVNTNQPYAVKIISKTKIPKNYLRKFVPREVDALKRLSIHQHPFISQMREFFETPRRIYLVTRLALGGDLLNYINSRKYLTEDTARRMICQLLCALDHIHDLNVVHRDLKCENLLIGPDECIMVTDFGFATQQPKNRLLTTFCGSYAYAAPEILSGSSYNGKCTDVWSVGVILYAMLNGKLPYNDTKPKNILAKIKSSPLVMTRQISYACEKFVRNILTINALERPIVSELLLKKWIEGSLKKVLKTLPEKVHPSCLKLNLPQRSSFRMSDSSEECLKVFTPRHSGTSTPQSPLTIAEEFIAHNSSHKTSSTISQKMKKKYRQLKSNMRTWASRKKRTVTVNTNEEEFAEIESKEPKIVAKGTATLIDIFDPSKGSKHTSKVTPINLKYAINGRDSSATLKRKPQIVNISNIGMDQRLGASDQARCMSAAPPITTNTRNSVDFRAKSCKPPKPGAKPSQNTLRRSSQDTVNSRERKGGNKKGTRRPSKQEEAINEQILSFLVKSREKKPHSCPQGLPPLNKESTTDTITRYKPRKTSNSSSASSSTRGDQKKRREERKRRTSYDKAVLYHNIQKNAAGPSNRTLVTPTKIVPVNPKHRRSSHGSRKGSLENKALAEIRELSAVYN